MVGATSGAAAQRRVVVGVSTIPSRISLLRPTLDSLLNQQRRPDRILVAVPKWSRREQCEYSIPDSVLELERDGVVGIRRVDEDYGPGTKLLGCLPEVRAEDVFIAADDDLLYRRFFIAELAGAVLASGAAASFYVYVNQGLRIGQGADGFAMAGRLAHGCAAAIPLILAHDDLRRHDDYWISYFLRKQGARTQSLASRCRAHGVDVPYEDRNLAGGLFEQENDRRQALNKRCHELLFRHAAPTLRMRCASLPGFRRLSRMLNDWSS